MLADAGRRDARGTRPVPEGRGRRQGTQGRLSSRSGAATPETVDFVASLVARGIETTVLKADIGSPADVKELISGLRAAETPLKGIFHLAMVIDDAPLSALTAERLRTVNLPERRDIREVTR